MIYKIGGKEDPFHHRSSKIIHSFLRRFTYHVGSGQDFAVLNAGAGRELYGLPPNKSVNLDLLLDGLAGLRNAVTADIHALPFPDKSFKLVVCVGSVLNYLNLEIALTELSRVLSQGGTLIIEYEQPRTLEFIFTDVYQSNKAVVSKSYRGVDHHLCLYSTAYVNDVARSLGLSQVAEFRFHIVSPLVLRLTDSLNWAGLASLLDTPLRLVNTLESVASNVLVALARIDTCGGATLRLS